MLAVPVACGQRRDEARLMALESGLASAQASLAALSPGAPSAAPSPLSAGAAPVRPVGTVFPPAGARPLAASDLLGAGPDALRRWFGDSDLRRPEGDAEVRLYLGPGCALDVVLYAEAAGGGMRVAHAAARAEGAAAVTEADCLRGLGGGGGGAGRAAAAGHSGGR